MLLHDRDAMRRYLLDAWRKAREGLPLEPLEGQIAGIVRAHPEYHDLLEDREAALSEDFLPDEGATNPFLHIGLHLAILEQVATDRPPGIRVIYQRIAASRADPHEAEHEIMHCLAEALRQAQRAGRPPDERAYLACLRRRWGGP